MKNKYLEYLEALKKPFKKLVKLEFLQPDNSVAFSLGNTSAKIGYSSIHDTRAFIQSGTLNISTNNGSRRSATITLSNLDNAFTYAVNKIWFGQKVRLSMGLVLPSGEEFYLPQGVFYIKTPTSLYSPSEKTVTFPLVDKWAYLDGTLSGVLPNDYLISAELDGEKVNVFDSIKALLKLSKYTMEATNNIYEMIDNVEPVFTNYYNDKTYSVDKSDGTIDSTITATDLPYDVSENMGGTLGGLITSLNETFVGSFGYDQTGAFRVEPSQEDITDENKPILWNFDLREKNLCRITEQVHNEKVYNDVLIVGEGLTGYEVWGRATNRDAASDTNANLIGLKTFYESKAEYWNAQQCADIAQWYLKRKTILSKSITIECSQMFHLIENRLVSIKRTDKAGSPVERHLINALSIPIGETGGMTINATSVNDIPIATVVEYSTQTGEIER